MKTLYAKYGELLVIDATYQVNENEYSLYIFVVVDNNFKSQVVSIALAAYEVQTVFDSLMKHFTLNNDSKKTQVIMSDKDMVESIAFRKFFPHATHLICHWHVNKNFIDNFKRKPTLEIVKQMINVQSIKEYEALKQEFVNI